MNRRQKIIVSVTGIFIVLLVIVGLTYAYFLTRINGNENTKSISVTTANLALVYGNDDGSVIGEGETIEPGTTFEPKTFTVTNQGNATTDYVVVIENTSVTYSTTVEVDGVTHTAGDTTTFESNDFTYTLTCESGCNGVQEQTTFPIEGGILVGNSIDVGETQTYSFTLTYNETGVEQSNDMNKTLNAKVNIKDPSEFNPYKNDKQSLAYNIINNSITGKTSTVYSPEPLTEVGEEVSLATATGQYQNETLPFKTGAIYDSPEDSMGPYGDVQVTSCTDDIVGKYIFTEETGYADLWGPIVACDGEYPVVSKEIMAYEQVLSQADDDYTATTGNKSYYYRGNVEDNYVTFANKCWRAVRIEGDGSVKLTLESTDLCSETMSNTITIASASYGYIDAGSEYPPDYIYATNGMKSVLTTWLTETSEEDGARINITEKQETFLKEEDWCVRDIGNTYTFKCLSGSSKDTSKIGVLTADEVIYAGAKYNGINSIPAFYLKNDFNYWWTLTYSNMNPIYLTAEGLLLKEMPANQEFGVRPAIVLKAGTSIISGGLGTKDNPYVINEV